MFKIILDNTGHFGKNVAEQLAPMQLSGSDVLQEFVFYGYGCNGQGIPKPKQPGGYA